jgi:integrase
MVLFGLYTGQRLGDIASLTWQNVDLQSRELRLQTEKTGRRQIMPLAAPVIRYLEALPSSDDPAAPVFPKCSATVTQSGRAAVLSSQFYGILVSAGLAKKRPAHRKGKGKGIGKAGTRDVSPLSFHCLRHTATSLLKAAGVSDSIAMEFVGHESSSVSRQYTHIPTEALRKAAAKLPDVTK